MEVVLVINHKLPVRIAGTSPLINGGAYQITPKSYNIKGELLTFEYKSIEYVYVSEINYYSSDRKNKKLKTGYCKLSVYNNYRKNDNQLENFLKIENWFDEFEFAKKGDLFQINKVEFSKNLTSNYSKYYIQSQYEFKVTDLEIDFSKSYQYPVENLDSNSPNYCKKIIVDYDQQKGYSTTKEGLFFTKNFKNKIGNIDISESAKEAMYEGIVKICFRIDKIFNEILDKLAIEKLADIVLFINDIPVGVDAHIFIDNHNPFSTYYFTRTDRTIAHLLVDWGWKDLANTKDIPLEVAEDQFYGGLYKPFNNYYEALVNLYQNLYGKDENVIFDSPSTPPGTWDLGVLNEQDNNRFHYLSVILPSSAISLLTLDQRIELINTYIDLHRLPGEAEYNVLKIIYSFYLFPDDGQKFLEFLLKKGDNNHTNFERLFVLFNDDTISQVSPVVGFFANEKTNRRNFIYGLYMLWKKSTYDFRYIPANVTANEDGINPTAFFLTIQGNSYYSPDSDDKYYVSLEFSNETSTNSSFRNFLDTKYEINENLKGENIYITKVVTSNRFSKEHIYLDPNASSYKTTEEMKLHLYQPINIIGLKEYDDLKEVLPQDPILPAFVYYYCEEYDRIKDMNAAWSTGIDVSLEIIAFFATGGVSIIKDLKYLKYITKIGKALRATTATTETVLTLRGAEAGFEVFTLTTSMCYNAANYIATTTDSETAEKIARLFFWLTMLGAGATIYARVKATKAAKEIISNTSVYGTLPDDVKSVINHLSGAEDVAMATFKTNLQTKYPNLYSQFIELTNLGGVDLQKIFLREFENASLDQFVKLNTSLNTIPNWKYLYEQGIVDRKIAGVISNEIRTTSILRYYGESNLKDILKSLDPTLRWKILDEIGHNVNLFNNFKNNSVLLEGWIRFRYEPNIISKFLKLSEDEAEMLIFLKKYGNCSDEGFKMIKSNPEAHINRLLEYQEASHHIEYFNKRRAEMLPPNFYNTTGNGGMFKKTEIDSAIDSEILFGGKARPIIKNIENGDIVMVGGSLNGKKIDFMGLEPFSHQGWSTKYNRNFKKFTDSISSHISKLNEEPYVDIIIIDYKYFETTSLLSGKPANYIKDQVDLYIEAKAIDYLNSNKLIKINY